VGSEKAYVSVSDVGLSVKRLGPVRRCWDIELVDGSRGFRY
jgi:hypothetical protein